MQYTLSILVENQAGVLSKISGLFSRRADEPGAGTTLDKTAIYETGGEK